MSSRCQKNQEILEAYTVGLADSAAVDQQHLKECPSCAQAFWEAAALRRQLEAYADSIDEQADERIEDEVLTRLAQHGKIAASAPLPARMWPKVAALAAMLTLASLILWRAGQPVPAPSTQSEAGRTFLAALERESARQEIRHYLDGSQLVLFGVLEGAHDCPQGEAVHIAQEQQLARSLLYQKHLLDPQLARPGNESLKKVCDELELLLIDVAGSEQCVQPDQVNLWREVLDSRSTLVKIRLLRREAVT